MIGEPLGRQEFDAVSYAWEHNHEGSMDLDLGDGGHSVSDDDILIFPCRDRKTTEILARTADNLAKISTVNLMKSSLRILLLHQPAWSVRRKDNIKINLGDLIYNYVG